jgi:hypothetical protein
MTRPERSTPRVNRMHAAGAVLLVLLLTGCANAARENSEAAAIGNLRAVMSAQATHAAMCDGSYAATFAKLVETGYLGWTLGDDEQPTGLGYRFRMSAVKGDGVSSCGDVYTAYEVIAEPASPGHTGHRYFRVRNDELQEATTSEFADARPVG